MQKKDDSGAKNTHPYSLTPPYYYFVQLKLVSYGVCRKQTISSTFFFHTMKGKNVNFFQP